MILNGVFLHRVIYLFYLYILWIAHMHMLVAVKEPLNMLNSSLDHLLSSDSLSTSWQQYGATVQTNRL